MPPDTARRHLSLASVVAWALFLTYFVTARGVDNLFPFSTFGMYARSAPSVVARVYALDVSGAAHEITELDAVHCEPARLRLAAAIDACGPDHFDLEYVVRNQQLHLDAHAASAPAAGAEAFAIVSRAQRVRRRPGEPRFTDCRLALCTARLDGGGR